MKHNVTHKSDFEHDVTKDALRGLPSPDFVQFCAAKLHTNYANLVTNNFKNAWIFMCFSTLTSTPTETVVFGNGVKSEHDDVRP